MAAIPVEYARVPSYAALLPEKDAASAPEESPSETKRRFSFDALSASLGAPRVPEGTSSHTRTASGSQSSYSLANLFVSSAINLPTDKGESSPRGPTHALLSTRDPLSIPITTTNFRKFVGKVGFIFWTMDRVEEIIMWRKGWKYTSSWIVLFAALCTPAFDCSEIITLLILASRLRASTEPNGPESCNHLRHADELPCPTSTCLEAGPFRLCSYCRPLCISICSTAYSSTCCGR